MVERVAFNSLESATTQPWVRSPQSVLFFVCFLITRQKMGLLNLFLRDPEPGEPSAAGGSRKNESCSSHRSLERTLDEYTRAPAHP